MINKLRVLAALLSVPSLLAWLWRRQQPVASPAEQPAVIRAAEIDAFLRAAMDEARYFEAEWREAEQAAQEALQELDEAYEAIAALHIEIDRVWELTRELMLLNACGFYSSVRFDYDDHGALRRMVISQGDRIHYAPAGDIDNRVPPAQWNRN